MGNETTLRLELNMVQRTYFGLNVVNGVQLGRHVERYCYGTGTGSGSVDILPSYEIIIIFISIII